MSYFKKLDFWSILDSLEAITDYDINGNEKDSMYWDFYVDQIRELAAVAADMWGELMDIKMILWSNLPDKKIEFCGEDQCAQTCIAWWNTAACMFSDIDMIALLESENIYCADPDDEKAKRIRAMERLTQKQYIKLQSLVIGFITRYLELVSAFDVITSCIRELDYHQSTIQTKSGAVLPDTSYL